MSIRVSNNPKNNSLSAIMKNPKLSKLVEEALQSPIGSTKREQAKSILGSVNSANQNFQDRRGGGGSWGFPAFSPAGIFERIGGTAAAGVGLLGGQMGKGAKTNWDFAQSIPGSMGNFSKEFFRQAGYGAAGALGAAETGLTFKPYSETAGARAQSNIQDLYASPPPTKKFPMRGGIPPEESGFADFGTMMSGGDNMFKTAPTGKETSLKTKTIPEKELEDLKATYPLTDWSNIMSGGDSILKTADNISADKVANKEYDDYSSGEGYDDDSSGKGYDDYSSDSSTSTDILGNEWPLLVDTLEKGYESGLGSQGIVNALRSNKKVIDELFPDMPEDLKPYGASMYRHVDKLTDQLREEHTIDEQLADINRMKKRG